MRYYHKYLFLLTGSLATGAAPSQNLSWSTGIPTGGEAGEIGIYSTNSGIVRVATRADEGIGTLIRSFDWQGTIVEMTAQPYATRLIGCAGGYMLAGSFQGVQAIGDDVMVGNPVYWRFYIARFNDEDSLLWVRYGAPLEGGTGRVLAVAVSAAGRTGVLLSDGPGFALNGDTTEVTEYGCALLCFLPDGSLEWSKTFVSLAPGNPFDSYFAQVAFDSEERLWLAASLMRSMELDGDTIEVSAPDSYDQLILRLNDQGTPEAELLLNGGSNGYDAVAFADMESDGDGGMVLAGAYNNGAQIPGIALDSLGLGNNALIMHMDEDLVCQWVTTFGTDTWDWVRTIERDPSTDEYMITGSAGGGSEIGSLVLPSDTAHYLFLAHMMNDGTLLDGAYFAHTGIEPTEYSYPAFAITPTNGPYHILGHVTGTMHFNNATLVANNAFVIRMDAFGAVSLPTPAAPNNGPVILPTPSHGHVNIHLNSVWSGVAAIDVRDTRGTLVHASPLIFTAGSAGIDLSHLTTGMYIVRLSANGNNFTRKIIIEQD